jgi:hypothetical protein
MPGRGAIQCTECGGSGRCSECQGTGANCRLNDVEPRCRACHGTSVCPACSGSGVESLPEKLDVSVYLRIVLTAITGFILYGILIGNVPVRFGRVRLLLPGVVGGLIAIGFSGPVLYKIWKDVKLSDFKFLKQRQLTSLFGDGDAPSTDNQHSRIEATPDEHIRSGPRNGLA